MSTLEEFLRDNPELLQRLNQKARSAYLDICASMAHLRSRKARTFFIQTHRDILALSDCPFEAAALDCAVRLSRVNWALVPGCLAAVRHLPHEEAISRWTAMASELAQKDIDAALAFLEQTPRALVAFGLEGLWDWGRQAAEALESKNPVWKAVQAYLEVAAVDNCTVSLDRWRLFLSLADRISAVSPDAARVFLQHGSRACLLLRDEETYQWVTEGLLDCRTEEERISFFKGTSQKAMEKRDGLVSGVALKNRIHILSLITEALLGRRVRIRSNSALAGCNGFYGGAATDGRTIFLPDMAPTFEILKLMTLHQAMLLGQKEFLTTTGRNLSALSIHLEADSNLLSALPSLRASMERVMESLPASYPDLPGQDLSGLPPWWGDILPELMHQTDTTICQIKQQASEYGDVPPELVESIMAAMMADGERDGDALWQMFREMMDNMEFTSPDAEELQENVKTFFYREWDQNLSDYKMDWCLVRQRIAGDDPNAFAQDVSTRLHGIIGLIRRQFALLKPQRFRRYRAQPSGDALDIDALVRAMVDMRSGSFLSENIYIRRDKRERDVAVLFLIDLSASTEEKINGRRVIDIQKEAMVLMAEALDSLEDPYAIFGFSSDGRFRVDMFSVKDFHEAYGDSVRNRIGNLEPHGLTRMGAVIRHAVYRLEGVGAAIKLMMILTDGRPYDLEYGNLEYAVSDTHKAIQEARMKRIHPFIITSDKKSTEYLNRIAPQAMSIILPRVEMLPRILPALYKRLTV